MFRLFDDDTGADRVVLEFLADPDKPEMRTAVLAGLPDTLQVAGVSEPALADVRQFLGLT